MRNEQEEERGLSATTHTNTPSVTLQGGCTHYITQRQGLLDGRFQNWRILIATSRVHETELPDVNAGRMRIAVAIVGNLCPGISIHSVGSRPGSILHPILRPVPTPRSRRKDTILLRPQQENSSTLEMFKKIGFASRRPRRTEQPLLGHFPVTSSQNAFLNVFASVGGGCGHRESL